MIDLALNENNDLNLSLIENDEETVQSIGIILRTRQGEFFGDPEMGLDQTNIFGKKYDREIASTDIFEALEQEERVNNSQLVSMIQTGRSLAVQIKANVGDTEIETEVNLE